VVVDLGYRGVDADNPGVQIIHRGKYKSLSAHEKRLLKRRQAIEPAIGHTKADHRMDRCWMKGALGDALHALCCAAGYNIRWLLRAIARGGLAASFFVRRTLHGDLTSWLWALLAALQTPLAVLLMTRPAKRSDGGFLGRAVLR
jgi:IS5 family transposase